MIHAARWDADPAADADDALARIAHAYFTFARDNSAV